MTGKIDPQRATAVYRLHDAEGQLLYVGSTADAPSRWEQHAREKLWWSAVTTASVTWYPNRGEALAAEREAIQLESPLHNDKATDAEITFPYQGNRGPTAETRLRRAASEHRRSLDRLAVAVERAASEGLDAEAIRRELGTTTDEVLALSRRLTNGGGLSSLA
ncbi:GIY-YIG nuclease family protein [Streptomyces katrae]|uniref:GIY-YIG nuclease family protein n=1 Tax=Streptomyces katrae TaxID=68223 RepID=UPI0004BE67A5|nr:GIY-YIG nuclease family protein [Streptomyces katrae]